jgi:hypothetical protein
MIREKEVSIIEEKEKDQILMTDMVRNNYNRLALIDKQLRYKKR